MELCSSAKLTHEQSCGGGAACAYTGLNDTDRQSGGPGSPEWTTASDPLDWERFFNMPRSYARRHSAELTEHPSSDTTRRSRGYREIRAVSSGRAPLPGEAALPGADNWLVLYHSETPHNEIVLVSGTIAVPHGEPPEGGWPVMTWTHGTTGNADKCAASRDADDHPAHGYIAR